MQTRNYLSLPEAPAVALALDAVGKRYSKLDRSHVRPPVFVRVGRSFNASLRQMILKVYVPALVPAIVNGMRLGLGLAIIGVLLGEIKLSDEGIGFLTIDKYNHFRIPQMYATLLLVFILAVGANALIGQLEKRPR